MLNYDILSVLTISFPHHETKIMTLVDVTVLSNIKSISEQNDITEEHVTGWEEISQ